MTVKEQIIAIESQIKAFKEQLSVLILDKSKEGFEVWTHGKAWYPGKHTGKTYYIKVSDNKEIAFKGVFDGFLIVKPSYPGVEYVNFKEFTVEDLLAVANWITENFERVNKESVLKKLEAEKAKIY